MSDDIARKVREMILAAAPAAIKTLAKRLGFVGLRLYDMRHNCASHMLAAGRPITEVAAQLGHSDASTTLRHYGFAVPKTEPGAGLLDDILPRHAP